jgi:hypothetical protein
VKETVVVLGVEKVQGMQKLIVKGRPVDTAALFVAGKLE